MIFLSTFQVKLSTISGSGEGLFAKRDIKAGEVVSFFGGFIVANKMINHKLDRKNIEIELGPINKMWVESFSWRTISHKDHLEVCLPISRLLSVLSGMWSSMKITYYNTYVDFKPPNNKNNLCLLHWSYSDFEIIIVMFY